MQVLPLKTQVAQGFQQKLGFVKEDKNSSSSPNISVAL